MSRRHIFTERQRAALFDLPTDELSLLKFYTLGDDDSKTLGSAADRKTGLALPCNFVPYDIRRALAPGEMIPREVLSFVGAQLGVPADALLTYATRRQTRQQHMDTLREIYGYKTFTGRGARDLREWTFGRPKMPDQTRILLIVLLCGVGKLPPFCPQYRQSSACARMFGRR